MARQSNHKKSACIGGIIALVSVAAMGLVFAFGSISLLVLVIGICCAVILGLAIYTALAVSKDKPAVTDTLELLFELSRHEDIQTFHKRSSQFLVEASKRHDTVFRDLLAQRLRTIEEEVQALGKGRIEFSSTESWRIFYEQILRSPGTHLYRSVSHIETQSYWQDGAGRKSTELNLELHDSGKVSVERIAIIADHLWRPDELFPVSGIHEWLEEQYRYGIWISLVRESDLSKEPELVSDFGIYGTRAVGRQVSDAAGRTSRFVLSFDYQDVEEAESLWEKLGVFAKPYSDLLDQQH